MLGAQAGASSCCSGAPAWSHLGGRLRAPPFRPLCLSVSLQEGGPAARTPPPPRPVSTALSLARCRLLGSGWGAAADAVTSRGVSPGLLPSSASGPRPRGELPCPWASWASAAQPGSSQTLPGGQEAEAFQQVPSPPHTLTPRPSPIRPVPAQLGVSPLAPQCLPRPPSPDRFLPAPWCPPSGPLGCPHQTSLGVPLGSGSS